MVLVKEQMEAERWGAQVSLGGFDPKHALWSKFAQEIKAHEGPSLHWMLPEMPDRRIRAIVRAESAETAMRQAMKTIRDVGHKIDRYDEVDWSDIEGRAYKL